MAMEADFSEQRDPAKSAPDPVPKGSACAIGTGRARLCPVFETERLGDDFRHFSSRIPSNKPLQRKHNGRYGKSVGSVVLIDSVQRLWWPIHIARIEVKPRAHVG
jgi:hypothetical protein